MRNNMIKVYLASPFDAERRKDMDNAIDTLVKLIQEEEKKI